MEVRKQNGYLAPRLEKVCNLAEGQEVAYVRFAGGCCAPVDLERSLLVQYLEHFLLAYHFLKVARDELHLRSALVTGPAVSRRLHHSGSYTGGSYASRISTTPQRSQAALHLLVH